jgi:hypothetical protein
VILLCSLCLTCRLDPRSTTCSSEGGNLSAVDHRSPDLANMRSMQVQPSDGLDSGCSATQVVMEHASALFGQQLKLCASAQDCVKTAASTAHVMTLQGAEKSLCLCTCLTMSAL